MDSKAYWSQREAKQLQKNITDELKYNKKIQEIYDYMLDNVQKEINGFYSRYASKEGVSLSKAKKRVKQLDIEAYERKAKKYVAEKTFTPEANEEMRLYNATMKINRLEMLKANIGLETVSGFNDLQKYFDTTLTDRTLSEFKRQAGILGKTVQDNQKLAHSIVNGSFHNARFSDRIWMYQAQLKDELDNQLQIGLIQGRNPRQLAIHISKAFGARRSDAERLMQTELARVQSEAQKQSFERNEYDQYEFIAEPTACPICRAMDGKIFAVKDMMPGENASPIHPNCRCSSAAHMDREEFDKWLNHLNQGGTTKDWEKFREKSVAKSGGNAKMISGAISGARNPYGKAADTHAKKYYGLVRKMSTDVSRISETTGYSEDEIQAIKNYLFIDEHNLGDNGFRRFDPDYMIGESWRRLIDGKPEPHDLTLINHEIMEKRLISQGISQDEAHIRTTAKYNYDKEASEFYGKIKKFRKE